MLKQYSKILITGAAGWLGSSFIHSLLKGISRIPELSMPAETPIRCLLLPGQKLQSDAATHVEVVTGDIRNLKDCENFIAGSEGSLLIHLAGIIHPVKYIKELYQVNLQGTQNLLDTAVKNGIKRMIVMSSNSPLGTNPHYDHVFDEKSPYNPYMNYGRSKHQMELAVMTAQSKSNLETVLIRSPWFYGPGQPERQTLFFKLIQQGKFPLVGDGNNRRSMAYTDNISQGILLAAENKHASGEIFWIADERPYAMNEIISTVQTIMRDEYALPVKFKKPRLPSLVGDIATFVDASIQKMGVYNQKIHVLSEMNKTIACTVEKAKQLLGYNPLFNLENGMRESIHWCIQKGYL